MLLKAQRMQRLARKLARLEASLAGASGDLEEIREGLEATAAGVGVDLETVRRLDPVTLVEALAPGGGAAPGRLWVAAEVLFLDGLTARAEGDLTSARRRLAKAGHLYRRTGDGLELPEGSPPPEERLERIGDLMRDAG